MDVMRWACRLATTCSSEARRDRGIAIGSMGSAIGRWLVAIDVELRTAVPGRSEANCKRAEGAGLRAV
jgi:hypothetical protein